MSDRRVRSEIERTTGSTRNDARSVSVCRFDE
jgi:hypothetical protein